MNETAECVTKLIKKPQVHVKRTIRRTKYHKKDWSQNEQDSYSNHRKRFHQKLIYNKPWKIEEENLKSKKYTRHEEKYLPDVEKPVLLPKDPVTLGRMNFRKANFQSAKKLRPPVIRQRYVDNRYGDTHDLISSGLVPIYIHRKQKIPKFLINKKKVDATKKIEMKTRENICDQIKHMKIKGFSTTNCRRVPSQEREELLQSMKKRWDQLMSEFQTLPFIISTPPQIKRKSTLENTLRQLEKDIDTIERHKIIIVYDDKKK